MQSAAAGSFPMLVPGIDRKCVANRSARGSDIVEQVENGWLGMPTITVSVAFAAGSIRVGHWKERWTSGAIRRSDLTSRPCKTQWGWKWPLSLRKLEK